MKFLFLLLLPLSSSAMLLEGRHVEKDDKCSILVNEDRLSGKKNLPVKCELFLVDKYKYRYEIDDSQCPYKVKKVKVIAPGVKAKGFNKLKELKKCK